MTEREEHILPGAADPNPSVPPPREPREIFPVQFDTGIGFDADFRPINTIGIPDEDLPDPKGSSALEPVEFSDSELQTQTETELETTLKDTQVKTVSPPAVKVSTPARG